MKFPKLANLIKFVCTLSHGQADVERGFSLNNALLENNIQELYITSRRLVKDYFTSNKLEPNDILISITQELILATKCKRSAHAKWKNHIENKRKEKESTQKNQAVNVIDQDIQKMKEKKSLWRQLMCI